MALNDVAHDAGAKKVELLQHDFLRFAARATLAGIYLTLATAFAGVAAQAVEAHAKGLGSLVLAFLFGIGLFAIIALNAELATGNMMFGSFGATLAVFVGLGLEHVIANFSLMTITLFASDPLPASFSAGAVLTNWLMVWLGNFVGGGVLMGCVYAWLNKTPYVYKD